MDGGYRCIVADPPWPYGVPPPSGMGSRLITGKWARMGRHPLPYPTLTIAAIAALPVAAQAAPDAHLWLWTTNRFLPDAFTVLAAWGFTYLTTITWVKPSGLGSFFVSTTQHVLFGYHGKCRFPLAKYRRTHFHANARRHSQKPEQFFDLCEAISPPPRLELFARVRRLGWDAWGNEVPSSVEVV